MSFTNTMVSFRGGVGPRLETPPHPSQQWTACELQKKRKKKRELWDNPHHGDLSPALRESEVERNRDREPRMASPTFCHVRNVRSRDTNADIPSHRDIFKTPSSTNLNMESNWTRLTSRLVTFGAMEPPLDPDYTAGAPAWNEWLNGALRIMVS